MSARSATVGPLLVPEASRRYRSRAMPGLCVEWQAAEGREYLFGGLLRIEPQSGSRWMSRRRATIFFS